MKKFLLLLLAACLCSTACAQSETALEYALWLEEALPNAAFIDDEIPDFVEKHLGVDYEFIARSDAEYGLYIAGVRRESAPALPSDAHQSGYGGSFESRVFQAADNAGNIYYEFKMGDGVYMRAFDGLQHLLIWIDPNPSENANAFSNPSGSRIFEAADAQLRAQLQYAAEKGFTAKNDHRSQLCFTIHNLETWRAGVTDQPSSFYLDMTPPENLLGESYLDEEALSRFTRIPIGLYIFDGETVCEMVFSEDGVAGIETNEPHRLYAAGSGYDSVLNLAEKLLGYRPGAIDFLGKTSVRAHLEWQESRWMQYDEASGQEMPMGWPAGRVEIADAASLRRLDAMLNDADFSIGSVNCPSDLFLVVDYSDGSSADFAVAVNSFDLFFRNGMYFTAGSGELIDLFDLKNTSFWKGFMENEPYVSE